VGACSSLLRAALQAAPVWSERMALCKALAVLMAGLEAAAAARGWQGDAPESAAAAEDGEVAGCVAKALAAAAVGEDKYPAVRVAALQGLAASLRAWAAARGGRGGPVATELAAVLRPLVASSHAPTAALALEALEALGLP